MFSTNPPRRFTAEFEQAIYPCFAMGASFGSIPMTSPGTSLHADPADLLWPGLSSKDKGLFVVGNTHPVKFCRTDFVLYPEMPLVAAVVFPRPPLTR